MPQSFKRRDKHKKSFMIKLFIHEETKSLVKHPIFPSLWKFFLIYKKRNNLFQSFWVTWHKFFTTFFNSIFYIILPLYEVFVGNFFAIIKQNLSFSWKCFQKSVSWKFFTEQSLTNAFKEALRARLVFDALELLSIKALMINFKGNNFGLKCFKSSERYMEINESQYFRSRLFFFLKSASFQGFEKPISFQL